MFSDVNAIDDLDGEFYVIICIVTYSKMYLIDAIDVENGAISAFKNPPLHFL